MQSVVVLDRVDVIAGDVMKLHQIHVASDSDGDHVYALETGLQCLMFRLDRVRRLPVGDDDSDLGDPSPGAVARGEALGPHMVQGLTGVRAAVKATDPADSVHQRDLVPMSVQSEVLADDVTEGENCYLRVTCFPVEHPADLLNELELFLEVEAPYTA